MSLNSTSQVGTALYAGIDASVEARVSNIVEASAQSIAVLSEGAIVMTQPQRDALAATIREQLYQKIYDSELARINAVLDAPNNTVAA